ncbi:MAG: hypothetical protein M1813_001272 [Trichoglossum hirsutum]|nr:MAG: hypothetical protein M1813_001272 [Trichoglossum hirsutum]
MANSNGPRAPRMTAKMLSTDNTAVFDAELDLLELPVDAEAAVDAEATGLEAADEAEEAPLTVEPPLDILDAALTDCVAPGAT